MSSDLSALEEKLGYRFRDRQRLEAARTHPSWLLKHPEDGPHNQRLEFLGDALLSMIIAEALFELLPDEREGILSRLRSALVQAETLACIGERMDVASFLRADLAGKERPPAGLIGDAVEALVAAIYCDSDYATIRRVVLEWYGPLEERIRSVEANFNPKGQLQEWNQSRAGADRLIYELVGAEGPDHAPRYRMQVKLGSKTIGEGEGSTKKEAEEAAAREALQQVASAEG